MSVCLKLWPPFGTVEARSPGWLASIYGPFMCCLACRCRCSRFGSVSGKDGEVSASYTAFGLLRVRGVVDQQSAAGGVQLAASGFHVPEPEDQRCGHRQWRVRAGQQPAVGTWRVAGQAVHHGAPVEERSGVLAQLRVPRIG